ncbi:MAG: VCBS repeat-containing protein [Armatimonadetes bacterium]|nr:VCBS repeat-containing protein [Armatimonadota bacterium]MDE2206787.1 VCBS repeat-containing protein [Armatimonadota bacterium]
MNPRRIFGFVAAAPLMLAPAISIAQTAARYSTVDGSRPLPASYTAVPAPAFAPTHVLHITFQLNGAGAAQIAAYARGQQDPASPLYHKWLTPDQFGAKFGATAAAIGAVTRFAAGAAFSRIHVWPNHLFVSADATVAAAQAAFHVAIRRYQRPTTDRAANTVPMVYGPSATPQVPTSAAAAIKNVFGLDNLLVPMAQHGKLQPALSPFLFFQAPGGFAPSDVSRIYNVAGLHNAGLNGDGFKIGIYSPTQWHSSDLSHFTATYGISGYTLQEVMVDGGPTTLIDATEPALDTEVIVGQAPHCTLVMYEGPENNLLDEFNAMAADNPPAVSTSWSINESDIVAQNQQQSLAAAWNTILAQMYTQGEALYAASGDSGATDANGTVTVSMPSSSQWVTGVGGTQLGLDGSGNWQSEIAWPYNPPGGSNPVQGSTGGLSVLFPESAWQTGPGVHNANSNGMRQVPDVAATAGNPGYSIYAGGSWELIGGTSASAPLWASIELLINQAGKLRPGNLNAEIYKLASLPRNQFHDIVSGNNGVFTCTPGWDYVTGWGSANFTGLMHAIVSDGFDFNDDGEMDLLFQNTQTGNVVYWLMAGAQKVSGGTLASGVSPAWQIVGTPDLTGNGRPDLLWENTQTGDVVYWIMNGAQRVSSGTLVTGNSPGWRIVGTPDLNGDGHPDILWLNSVTGTVAYWYMVGTHYAGGGTLYTGVSSAWTIVGTPDLNGDGHPDLLWQNTQTGDVVYWLLNGVHIVSTGVVATGNDPAWRVVGQEDLNLDGYPDLIWQNQTTGDVAYWLMQGVTKIGGGSITTNNHPVWQIVGLH